MYNFVTYVNIVTLLQSFGRVKNYKHKENIRFFQIKFLFLLFLLLYDVLAFKFFAAQPVNYITQFVFN